MRRILAGLLILLLSSAASGQVKAEVESIGFNNHYRPDCWTPMVVRITPEKSGTYQLHVMQEDLDADQPTFTQEITLTGSDEGPAAEQRFWMYFIPQPTHGGLYDVSRMGTVAELNKQIQVYLCDAKGKQLQRLPITSSIINLEPQSQNLFVSPRGTKLVLAVGDGTSKIIPGEWDKALGVLESVQFVPLQSRDLPESPRGYEAVDAIVWTNANAPSASSPAEERRLRAIQEWVKRGGRLVICQPPERDRTLPWGDMLPVIVNDIGEQKDVAHLAALAQPSDPTKDPSAPAMRRVWVPPMGPRGPFRVARADPKPGTVVENWIAWDSAGKDRTPYIARMGYGLGSVTWVAQDLGDQAITNRATLGWTNVWNRVLGWNDSSMIKTNLTREDDEKPWSGGGAIDVSRSMMSGAELGAKSRAFVGLAVIFFIVYWLVAGPGLYLYLLAKARAYMSWFMFGASAIVATAVTVLVVQLVVRGDPELAHVSIVRKAAGEPAVIISRFGLYIPEDGRQSVSLRDIDPSSDSYVTALAEHPKYVAQDSNFPAFMNYFVPVHQPGSGEAVEVAFPYRSTLRKLQARWVGVMNGGVEGGGKIVHFNDGTIQGTITNGTGQRLQNVYIAFHHPSHFGRTPQDVILYLPAWDKGLSIDLTQEFAGTLRKTVAPRKDITGSTSLLGLPERNEKVQGTLASESAQWPGYWYEDLRSSGIGGPEFIDDSSREVKKAFPMMSFFSRLPPMKNPQRMEILRRGQRMIDIGHALAAGKLVVLAEGRNTPLPFNLDVDGEKVAGNGMTYYQFVLPLDRTASPGAREEEPAPAVEQPNTNQPGGTSEKPPLLTPVE